MLDSVIYCDSPYDAMQGADAAALVTEWNAFRALDLARVKALLSTPVFVDLRNVYRAEEVEKAGLTYVGVGR